MTIDTDMQWAFWDGVKNYYEQRRVIPGQIAILWRR